MQQEFVYAYEMYLLLYYVYFVSSYVLLFYVYVNDLAYLFVTSRFLTTKLPLQSSETKNCTLDYLVIPHSEFEIEGK